MGLKRIGLRRMVPALLLLLSACGYKGPLTRVDPDGMDRAALEEVRAVERVRVEQALTPTPEQRPVRVDDISIRLEERSDDPFDLPPD